MTIQSTAISGLLAAQRALTVTSHNISNVNTPGYSRQRVELNAREANLLGNGFVGNGVEISSILRAHDAFLTSQVRSSISGESEASAFLVLANQVDEMLAGDATGLTLNLQNFFNSVQDVSDQPGSIAARQVMLSEAESLSARFQFLDSRMESLSSEVRSRLASGIRETNTLIDGIALINNRIVKAMGDSSGQPPNDLLDTRDKLIEDLSEFIGVSVVEQGDGSVNVFVGKGQPLVVGSTASTISLTESYSDHFEISLSSAFGTSDITSNIKGGALGGTLDFQNQMLDPARNALGRLAIGLADTFNEQHRLGQSLDGDLNLDFFNTVAADVIPLSTAPNNVSAAIVDVSALTDSNYSLVYNGGNAYTLTRISDGQVTALNTGGLASYTTPPVDGFTLTINSGAAVNDEYIVRPVINGAGGMSTTITDPRKIAAAAVLRAGEQTDSSGVPQNLGSAEISEIVISDLTGLPLGAPVTLTFDSVLNQFNVSAPPGGSLVYDPSVDSGGKQFTFASPGGATFSISGVPENGDQFIIENNTNATGDNQNALSLAQLQTTALLIGGTASYQDAYGQLVAEVGTNTRQTQISSQALDALRSHSLAARDSVSGVNLEEEAANMLKFQQAFQASAQMINTADRVFQTLLQAVQ